MIFLGLVLMVLGSLAFSRVSPHWFQSQAFIARVAAELSPALRVPIEARSYYMVTLAAMGGGALLLLLGVVDRMRGTSRSRHLTHGVLDVIGVALVAVIIGRSVGAYIESGRFYPEKVESASGTTAPVPAEMQVRRSRLLDEGAGGLEDLRKRAWAHKREHGSWRGVTTENLWKTLRFGEPSGGCWTYGVGRTSDGSPTTSTGWQAAIELVAWARPERAPRCAALSKTDVITLTLRGDGTFSLRNP